MSERLTPSRMAALYFSNMHFAAVKAAQAKVEQAEPNTPTHSYWIEVLELVEAQAKRFKNYRAGTPAQNTKGEANV